jgi:hypothetical protein
MILRFLQGLGSQRARLPFLEHFFSGEELQRGDCSNLRAPPFEVDPVFLDTGLGDNQWIRRTGRWPKIEMRTS